MPIRIIFGHVLWKQHKKHLIQKMGRESCKLTKILKMAIPFDKCNKISYAHT